MNVGDRLDICIDEIIVDATNPTSRTTVSAIKKLKESIERRGRILYPVLITADKHLRDGHRRLACAKAVGWEPIPADVVEEDPTLFAVVNITHRPMKRFEWFLRYLDGGNLPTDVYKQITEIEQMVGRDTLIFMRENHIGPSVITVARHVMNYIGADRADKDMLRKVLFWLIFGRRQGVAYSACKTGIDPKRLYDLILAGKDIPSRWGE